MKHAAREFLSYEWRNIMDSMIVNNVLDSMSDSLLVIGEDGQILYANKITKDILGYSLEEFGEKGLDALFFLRDQDPGFSKIFVDAVWKKSINDYTEVDYRHPDGSERRLAATSSYLLAEGDDASTFIGFVVLFKDITETFILRRKENELKRDKERIAREKIRSLHKLAMGVAHEIRNPMVTIGGFAARILKDSKSLPAIKQYAQNILDDAQKLERVVDEIQAYCNLPEVKAGPTSPGPVILEIISEKTDKAAKRNIQILFINSLPEHFEITVDAYLIKMAVSRLLDNAIDFSNDDSAVEVKLAPDNCGVRLEIRDSGLGVDQADKEYMFDPFFTTKIHGSGMGLAIVERIINEHNGSIDVESERGKGTAVKVFLPEDFCRTPGG